MSGGRNKITTAFKGTYKSIQKWINKNARPLSLDLNNSSLPGQTMDTSSMPSHLNAIVEKLKSNVKSDKVLNQKRGVVLSINSPTLIYLSNNQFLVLSLINRLENCTPSTTSLNKKCTQSGAFFI